MLDWYQDFYNTVEKSKVYSEYCNTVFGRDFSQQGFSNGDQISKMIDLLAIKPKSNVLDIGCGNGKFIEYVSDIKNCIGYGFDYSSSAIKFAKQRTEEKKHRLVFDLGSIGTKKYPDEFFDSIISIDTFYFAEDMVQTLKDINRWLKIGGKLAVFFSEFRFNNEDSIDKLSANGTQLAKAFEKTGFSYTTYDFTENHFYHMKLKKQVALKLKNKFEAEGSVILFDNVNTESIEDATDIDSFKNFSSRYLYLYVKRG